MTFEPQYELQCFFNNKWVCILKSKNIEEVNNEFEKSLLRSKDYSLRVISITTYKQYSPLQWV